MQTRRRQQYWQAETTILAVNVQKSHTNASEGKAVVYNDDTTEQLPSVYDTADQDIKMTECDAYIAVGVEGDKNSHTHDEDITMMGCDAYDVTSAGDSKNHQVTHAHNEDDIAMTECDAYGSNHQTPSALIKNHDHGPTHPVHVL